MPNFGPEWEDPTPPDQGDNMFPNMVNVVGHWVSKYCEDELCRICNAPATHKVSEVIFNDEPMPIFNIGGKLVPGGRHEYVAYVCCDCFKNIFGGWTHEKDEEDDT